MERWWNEKIESSSVHLEVWCPRKSFVRPPIFFLESQPQICCQPNAPSPSKGPWVVSPVLALVRVAFNCSKTHKCGEKTSLLVFFPLLNSAEKCGGTIVHLSQLCGEPRWAFCGALQTPAFFLFHWQNKIFVGDLGGARFYPTFLVRPSEVVPPQMAPPSHLRSREEFRVENIFQFLPRKSNHHHPWSIIYINSDICSFYKPFFF